MRDLARLNLAKLPEYPLDSSAEGFRNRPDRISVPQEPTRVPFLQYVEPTLANLPICGIRSLMITAALSGIGFHSR